MNQPDLGTAIIMLMVLLVMLAVAGLPARILIMLIVGVVLVALVAVEGGLLHHYQIARLTTFLHPNATSNNPFIQSATTTCRRPPGPSGPVASSGPGLGHGTQTNLGYVPEQQTDFIFTAVGEQLGFIGAAGLLALLGIIAWRILRVAGASRDVFGRLVCTGLFTFFAFSVFQNCRDDHGDHAHHRNPTSIRELRRYGGTVLLHVRGPGAQYRAQRRLR